jgi:glycosyltransferase involved in cell wall biosynthesis
MRGVNRPGVVMISGKLPEPVHSGLDLRIQSQITALSSFCDVTLVALHGLQGSGELAGIPFICLGGGEHPDPTSIAAHVLAHPKDPYGILFSAKLARNLRTVLESLKPTAIIFSRLQSWIYADSVRGIAQVPLILDLDESAARLSRSFQALDYSGIQRKLHLRFTAATAQYEAQVLTQPDLIWVSSELERSFIIDRFPHIRTVHVVVNAVSYVGEIVPRKRSDRFTVIFPANFAYPPNIRAAREIIDEISPQLPDMDFVLAGSFFPAELEKCRLSNVVVHSPVADMRSLLAAADAAVLPIRAGGGTRLKAIECFAYEVPVVATQVAMEGLEVEESVHYLRAESALEFGDHLRILRNDPSAAVPIKERARHHFRNRFTVTQVEQALRRHLSALIS